MNNLPSTGPAKATRSLPVDLCRGSGTVSMISLTGDGYDYSACTGCQACTRPAEADRMPSTRPLFPPNDMAAREADPFGLGAA